MPRVDTNVIVIDDEDDVVKREPETVSVTRTNSDEIPVKREPRERNDERPAPKQSRSVEVSYLNSEDDSSSVVVVTKYLAEFSNICASHGFKLSIECTNGTQMDVKIFQSAPNCNARKAFQEMDALLKNKKEHKEDLETTVKTITKELSEYKEKVDKLISEKSETTGNNVTVKTTNAPKKNYLTDRGLSVNTFMKTTSGKIDMKRFFLLENLEIFKISKELRKEVCGKLTIRYKPESPFYQVDTTGKIGLLVSYLTYLQNGMTRECTEPHQKFCDRFNDGWTDFLFKPLIYVLRDQATILKNKFNSKENIVGTVQCLPFKGETGDKFYLCFALIDFKIVCCCSKHTKDGALKKLHKELRKTVHWDNNYKFAFESPVPSGLGDTFIHSQNKDLFEDGEKVITWMKNNFKCLSVFVYGDHDAAIPALYNMAYMFVENQQ